MEKKDKLFFGLVIICILLVSLLVFYMRGEGGQCIKNPYVYGASKMGNVYCSCQQDQNRSFPAYFSFNDTSFSSDPRGQTLYTPISFNNLSVTP